MNAETKKRISPRKAISLHCRSCIYDPKAPGSCLQQIMDCTVKTCELYDFRPQRKTKPIKTDLGMESPSVEV